jgi:hypothetical protein
MAGLIVFEPMDLFQYMLAVPWFAGGLLFWPCFVILRGNSDTRSRWLRRIFLITLAALIGLGALLGIVAFHGQFNHNWLPVTLFFPIINLVSIIISAMGLFNGSHGET